MVKKEKQEKETSKKKASKKKTNKKAVKKKAVKKTQKKKISEKEKQETELEEKKKKLQEKAKQLAAGMEERGIKEQLEEERELEKQMKKPLVDLKEYLKSGIYIGTKVITPHMKEYVYKRRNDGIATIDTNVIDTKIKEMIEKISKYPSEDFIVVCKREAGWKAVEKFGEITGVRVFTKKYPAGILTNINLQDFFETEMVFICDPWVDKNALNDAVKTRKKVFGLSDTNNYTFGIDFFIPCNNKSNKPLELIFYLLSKGYLEKRGEKEKAEKLEREDFE